MHFPSKSDPFFKNIYLLASLKTHSAYYQAAGYTNRIKRKRKLEAIEYVLLSRNQLCKRGDIISSKPRAGTWWGLLLPLTLPTIFSLWGRECGTLARELSLLIYRIALLSSQRTPSRLSWEGSVHVLVKSVPTGGINFMGSSRVFSG